MAASRPMREDAGKGRQRSFKFERNSLNMMVCCVKNKLLKQTRCQRQKQNKRKNKQNKGENTTKQTGSRFGCFHSMLKGEKGRFSLAKMSIGLKTPFWKIFQPIGGLQLASVHIKARCLYFNYSRKFPTQQLNLSVRQILTQRNNGSYQANCP